MQRLAAYLLLISMIVLGTGVLEYVHALGHAREDAAEAAAAIAAGQPAEHHPVHDDNNCPVHASLHMLVIIVIGWALMFVCVGRSIPFAVAYAKAMLAAIVTAWPSCRDPPFALG